MRLTTLLFFALLFSASAHAQTRRAQPPPQQQQPAPASRSADTPQQEAKQPVREETKPPTLTPDEIILFLEIKGAEVQLQLNALTPPTEQDKANAGARLALLYAKAAKSPALSQMLIGDAVKKFENLREGAKGAMQVSQAADEASVKFQLIIMAQNQRIIELLEQVVKKR